MFQTLTSPSGMIMDVVAQGGKIIDTAWHKQLEVMGGASVVQAEVATGLVTKP